MARRRGGQRARSSVRRTTPRRWLPFLALIGLTAGAVVAVRTIDPPDPVAETGPHPATFVPAAAEAEALSSAWYCAAGSGLGDEARLDTSILVANAHESGARAVISLVGGDGATEEVPLDVPAHGRASMRVADHLGQEWVAATVEIFGGRATVERSVRGPQGFEIAPCSSSASSEWFVPSGSTLRGATEYLALYNPFGGPTSVDISFATDEGPQSPQALQGVSVPARSVRVVMIENPARRAEVAAHVTARSGSVVVDRIQVYDGTGDEVTGILSPDYLTSPPFGLVVTPALPRAAPRWFFPEARVVLGGRTMLGVYNPSVDDATLTAEVIYQEPDRQPEMDPLQLEVGAGEQVVVDLSDNLEIITDEGFMIDLVSDRGVPVVAELMVFAEISPDEYDADEEPEGEGPGTGVGEVEPGGREPELPPEEADGTTPEATENQEEEDHDHGDGHVHDDGGGVEVEVPYSPVVRLARGATVLPGTPVGATSWLFAAHGHGEGRTAYIMVANPTSEPVEVRAHQLTEGQRVDIEDATLTVPARDRRVLDLTEADSIAPILVTADGTVVATRLITGTTEEGLSLSLGSPFPETARLLRG